MKNFGQENMSRLHNRSAATVLFLISALTLRVPAAAEEDPEAAPSEYLTERPAYAGLWVNTFGNNFDLTPYTDIIAGEADRPKWGDIETIKGDPDFSNLDTTLQRCIDRDYYYYAEVWTSHLAPGWLYDNGVPRVEFIGGQTPLPYYLDENYIHYVTNFFNDLAGFIAGLPQSKRSRIVFLQPGFGSTGDRQLYKGTPINSAYDINTAEYVQFMQTMTIAWHAAFAAHPETANMKFLWNIDDYDGPAEDTADQEKKYATWMRANYNCQFRKQQFTPAIGYMACNEMDQDNEQRDFFYGNTDRHDGNPEFVRGEFNDAKWAATMMAKEALPWHYYWTAISSVDRGLDAWECRPEFITTGNYNEAYAFSTRYSFYKRAERSPYAFIALRDVLDYSDADRFSHLPGSATRGSLDRINAILAE
ncbi:MAG TPA: hypothetical protein VJ904_05265, partial [Tichowtungia sp.]|nr:hypothetical protein [Tichowtungia sp.]